MSPASIYAFSDLSNTALRTQIFEIGPAAAADRIPQVLFVAAAVENDSGDFDIAHGTILSTQNADQYPAQLSLLKQVEMLDSLPGGDLGRIAVWVQQPQGVIHFSQVGGDSGRFQPKLDQLAVQFRPASLKTANGISEPCLCNPAAHPIT